MRSSLLLLTTLALAAGTMTPAPARAQTVDACYKATLADDDDKVVSICSGALRAPGLSANTRSLTLSNRGLGYLRKGDYDRSITDFNEAIRLDGSNAFAYDNRGDAYREKGLYDEAIRDYDAAIRIDRDFASAYLNRALAFEKKGDIERARSELRTVAGRGGDRAIDKWARTEAERHLKRLDSAGRTR